MRGWGIILWALLKVPLIIFAISDVIGAYCHWSCEFDFIPGWGVLHTFSCSNVCQWPVTVQWFFPVFWFSPPIKLTAMILSMLLKETQIQIHIMPLCFLSKFYSQIFILVLITSNLCWMKRWQYNRGCTLVYCYWYHFFLQ